jgi:hypothetical protein
MKYLVGRAVASVPATSSAARLEGVRSVRRKEVSNHWGSLVPRLPFNRFG